MSWELNDGSNFFISGEQNMMQKASFATSIDEMKPSYSFSIFSDSQRKLRTRRNIHPLPGIVQFVLCAALVDQGLADRVINGRNNFPDS
jgi:hypothetical protein